MMISIKYFLLCQLDNFYRITFFARWLNLFFTLNNGSLLYNFIQIRCYNCHWLSFVGICIRMAILYNFINHINFFLFQFGFFLLFGIFNFFSPFIKALDSFFLLILLFNLSSHWNFIKIFNYLFNIKFYRSMQ